MIRDTYLKQIIIIIINISFCIFKNYCIYVKINEEKEARTALSQNYWKILKNLLKIVLKSEKI